MAPLVTLFDRAAAAFDTGNLPLARDAYEALSEAFNSEDDYGRGISAPDLIGVDMREASARHLRAIYEHLAAQLEKTGRAPWLGEEAAVLLNPETYITRPDEAWERIRTRSGSPRFLAVVRELARFRETYALSLIHISEPTRPY